MFAQYICLPIGLLVFWLSYAFVEPWVVGMGKHWIAHNQKKFYAIILCTDSFLCNAGMGYVFERTYITNREQMRTWLFIVMSAGISKVCLGLALRQLLDPLYPGFFMDRPKMLTTLYWLCFFAGIVLHYILEHYLYNISSLSALLYDQAKCKTFLIIVVVLFQRSPRLSYIQNISQTILYLRQPGTSAADEDDAF